jgi:hypothetical protein
MATDYTNADLLYAEFDSAAIRFGVSVASALLFAVFSYYLSRTTGADWFSRSGSIMALIGAVATFGLVDIYQKKLVTALNGVLVSLTREVELALEPPRSFQILSYFGYLTGIIGTGIWGYGDLLLRLVS